MQVLNNISAVPFQDRMFNLFHQNDQVAGNTSPLSRVALAAHGQLHAIADPWRNVERNGFFPTRNTFSAPGCAFIGNHLAFAMAGRAGTGGLHLPQNGIGNHPYTAGAVTGSTRFLCASIFGATPAAGLTGDQRTEERRGGKECVSTSKYRGK